jgi:hypothetical protein
MIQLTQQEAHLILEALETSTDEGVPEPFRALRARIEYELAQIKPGSGAGLMAA